jgi:hypothetical protein
MTVAVTMTGETINPRDRVMVKCLLLLMYTELHLMIDGLWRVSYTSDEDCIGALLGIVRLQNVYQLSARTLARGLLNNDNTPSDGVPSMDATDCRHLAVVAMKQGLYKIAREWIDEGLERTSTLDKKIRKHLKILRKFAKAGLKVSKSSFNLIVLSYNQFWLFPVT